ncbi:amino acid adenylation domain-containing protein [Actinokineospora sp.]|uniref:amino acid adenylation domain-containing protein n=1 Tax=Actinokineospora sp. TaxID=1872133 RepID=UPI004037A426
MTVEQTPVPTREAYLLPTSFGQRRLWFLDQLEPGSNAAYVEHGTLRLSGKLDADALRRALDGVVDRHETLRTAFLVVDGEPVQAVRPHLRVPIDTLDVGGPLPAGTRTPQVKAALADTIREYVRRPFDLSRAPLFRAALAPIGVDDHVLVVAFHHAVYDQWSGTVFVRELLAGYDAELLGTPLPRSELAVQYGDFAAWQREWVGGDEETAELGYWEHGLAGMPPLELPTDRPRPAAQTFDGATVDGYLTPQLVERLEQVARDRKATLFMTVLAAFTAVLGRHSGQHDFGVGTPVAGRRAPELEHLIGFFVNNLVIRADLSGDPSFGALVERVRVRCLEGYAHAEVPFERVVERLRPARDLARSPLSSVMFVFGNVPPPALGASGVSAELFRVDPHTAKFDLFVTCVPDAVGGLSVTIEHNRALFDEQTAARLLDHLLRVLDHAAADPELALSALPMLGDDEHAQLVRWGAGPARDLPAPTVLSLIAERAVSTPDGVAVRGTSGTLTYRELLDRARRITAGLGAAGVRPGQLVGVAIDRDLDLPAALLGVLGCGAAYLPIDTAMPAERIRLVLRDSGAAVVLANVDGLPAGTPTVALADVVTAEPGTQANPDPTDLAYVIYTSGSTGTPKGVAIPHSALVNLLTSMTERPGLSERDVFAAVTTLSFDIAALEVFGPLVAGGCVDIVARDTATDGAALAAHLRDATVMQATPTTWRLLVAAGWRPRAGFGVWCGGEVVPTDLAHLLRDAGASVWHLYGPTETTVWSAVHEVTGGERTLPLGLPVANTDLLVVDGGLRRVPIGAPGELLIGGAGLAAGYWRRDDLTRERFVVHPETGARVYRTGDLVRRRADGALEFLGRSDFQVKVRGYRVELGEIEAVLRGHDDVRDAVVVLREVNGDPRLVAYLVPGAGQRPEDDELRAACQVRLPEYMVPATFVRVTEFPLTPNGKVDREALPEVDLRRADEGYIAPRTDTERALAAIFAELLGVDRVGAHDDFFALGGHSLLATGLVGRVATALGVTVGVRTVFTHPTVALLADAVRAAGTPDRQVAAIAVVPREPDATGRVRLPASFQQRRVWFLTEFDTETGAAYTLHGALRLRGLLDPDVLRRAVALVTGRHEVLRTGFTVVDGEPMQVIDPTVPSPLSEVDLSGSDAESALAELLSREVARPFDLSVPPLLRLTLATLGPDDAALVVVLHHAIADRLGIEALTTELSTVYTALAAGDEPRLPELPVQYGDYACHQQQWAGGPEETAQVDYWRGQLADLPTLELPTDRPRPAVQTHRGATRTTELPADLVARLTETAARHGATLFMALLAGYALTLSRYARSTDIAIGSPISGRHRPELEPLIGYFTNNLVLRVDLDGDPTVGALLDQVKATCLDGFGHADVPFERLVERLRPERHLAHSPLFQTMLIAAHLPAPSLRLGELTATPLSTPDSSAKYDLTFTVFPAGPATTAQQVVAEYNTDLFDAETVDRMLAQYRLVLAALTMPADRRLSELPTLPADERARLITLGTGARLPLPELSLTGLLDPKLREFADRVAVADEHGTFSYAELDERATKLANHLRGLGVVRGDKVALFAERSRELLVALLGVLRAGAAYVPIDVDFPADRVAYVLRDSASVAVLTQADLADKLPAAGSDRPAALDRVVCLDSDWPTIDQSAAVSPVDGPEPDDLAYVIYTSGSTGRPKGVLLPHRPVVNFLLTMANSPGMAADDVVGAANAISCDMPVLDMYLPLLRGARVEMVTRDVVADGERLAARLRDTAITYLQGTPTTWRLLQQAGWRPSGPFTALAGAEKVPADLGHWLRNAGAAVWHLYGPTETTVWSTVHQVAGGEETLPLGRPVANTDLLVVDDRLRRVPLGVPGELLIGGAGVAAGYWQRDELTAQRFVAHPELGERSRVYRTGDLVRWRTDGSLEFLGRLDFQVKLRGYRIELGEIEAVLRGHPDVRDAVVVVREDSPGDRRVVGYVDLRDPHTADRQALVRELHGAGRERLPEYMVPAALVVLDELPLTANRNKIDRAKLPAPDGARPEVGDYVEPRTDTERTLASIFAEVLGLDRVGAHDDFFALGGHSLLAARVVARIRAALEIGMAVRAVFEHPTVAGLAETLPARAVPAVLPQIPPQVRMPQLAGELAGRFALPASSGQRRLWFLSQLDPRSAGAYTVDAAVRLTGPLDADALRRAVDAVLARHESLRTAFVESDGDPMQVVSPAVTVPVRHLDVPENRLTATLTDLSGLPFDLATAPLMRVTVVRVGDREHVLHLALHHAVCDRWSVQILAADLIAGYEGGTAEPLSVQYGDYAAWQQRWLIGDGAAAQARYWRGRLADLPDLDLPTDRPRPAVRGYRGDLRWRRVPAELVRQVTETGQRHGATLFMVALAACQLTLARYSGQRDFAIGSPVAGRPAPELERLVGFFVNNLVLRTDLAGDPTVTDLLARVKSTCLDAYANADLPFDRIVEELAPTRDRARTPLFTVLFAVQNTPDAARRMGEASVVPIELAPGTAQFDLSVMLVPDSASGDLRLRVEYDGELFDADTVDRMIAQYLLLLNEIAANPARRVSQLPPLTAEEHRLVSEEWVRTTDVAGEIGLAQAFADQAARTPDAIAVECGGERLSYQDLLTRSAAVARGLGVAPGARVGLCLDRSLDLVVGLLGILGAGAAYVPLDPAWPTDRMAYVLADAGVDVLLADRPIPHYTGKVLSVKDFDAGTGESFAPTGPDDLAYLIYTSGSTGRPKGVMVTHRNVARLVNGVRQHVDLSADDVWSMFHSVAFDVSVFELWGAWLTGGRVVVVPYLASRDPEHLRRLLAEHRVTVLSQTPTAFRQLAGVDVARADRLDALRYIVFAGEALDVRVLGPWLDKYGDGTPVLVNMYGTTETTVHATYHRVRATELGAAHQNRVGRPLPDLTVHLLDADGSPVPVGAVGEIHIGGPGVSHGYAGRPELTAERFIESPERRYRTGDMARWLPDGTLDFRGRRDSQVKIRGFRVELGEIEAVLREHGDVADAVVVARPGRAEDTELACYVVAHAGADPTRAELTAHARLLLPDYLVPRTLTVLEALPRTANGKIDLRALPEPDQADGVVFVAPRDECERMLARVWQDVLGVDRVGAHDNFFDLGGHSLLATRAMSRTRVALGRDARVSLLFDRPVLADLAAALSDVDKPADQVARLPRTPGQDGTIELPVSSAQRRLWLLDRLDAASAGAYVIGTAVKLTGPLDVPALRAAFDAVVARHEPLRTAFTVRDGEPVQTVCPNRTVALDVVDEPDVDAVLRDRLTAPFDLAGGPLVRATLARVSAGEHVLLLAMHHAIGDQWSTQVIVADLVAAYRALVTGQPNPLTPLDIQFADLAAHERDRVARGDLDTEIAHWVERLAGLPVLDLPTDHPRPMARSYRGGQRSTYVAASVVTALAATARDHDATPFMAALAAYDLMLSRYCGQTDFGVAVPVACRDRPEAERVVGFFANTLVLRADLAGVVTVGDLLGRVRRTCLDAYAHAGVPFETLVEHLSVPRDLSRTPVAQVGFALIERVAAADREFAGVRAEPLAFDPSTAKTDLTITVVPADDGGWRVVAEYAADLFDPSTVDRMLAHFVLLLDEFAADPRGPIAALPALPAAELAQLTRWGTGPTDRALDTTWPDLFEAQVARTPDGIALVHGDQQVSFAELNARANRLAHHLITLGVQADSLVGLVADRSVEMVVGVLATHKAGGAYVPVDPTYPAERIAFMLDDASADVLLIQRHLTHTVSTSDTTVVLLEDDHDGPADNPPRRCRPDHIAYVIYTSGSTGTPKGVCVEHRSVANLHLAGHRAHLHEHSRVLQFAPFSFDVSVFEMVLSLLSGVPLVIPTPRDLAGGVEIVGLINRERITFTFLPPSLLAHLSPEHVPTIELLGSGGEDCPPDVAERWGGAKEFLIGYGPTECTVFATVTDRIVGGGHPPIGRPVENTIVRVLDDDLRPRPIGVPGELYIGGAGLARGYLDRPEQTAAAFISDPGTGQRVYRTGDLVRYLPDGNLEFLGRVDEQVKIRGFRIELGEITAAMRAHPAVRDAVAVAREDSPGDRRLVGYVTADADPTELSRSVRAALAERLPRYMVPAFVVVLAELPLTPSGKVDRRALPAPEGAAAEAEYVAPRTPTERRLTRLVAETLRIERVGLDDDFFALGGHSLLAARLHATIRRIWQVDLPIRSVFEHPRIGALADLLDSAGTVDTAAVEAEHAAALRADVALPADIAPVGEVVWSERPETVLVTGATGFLGAFLVERLAETGATVLCLVRGADDAQAQRRLEEHLRKHELWRPSWAGRVRAVNGDLAAPRLGLSEVDFAGLARSVDEIYHSGAVVHFLRPYSMLRDGNVLGTIEVLRLATADRPVPVHYISTMSVFGGLAGGADLTTAVLREDRLPDVPPPAGDTGYNHSKWVAEQIVALARERGVPVAVYRPGRIGGDSRTGIWRTDDLVSQVIRACATTGLVPDAGLATDLVPVDHMAAAIARLARVPASLDRTFHFALAEKLPLVSLADALTAGGWPARPAPLRQWYEAVTAAAEHDPVLGSVLAMYAPLAEGRVHGPGEPVFDTSASRELLGAELPPPRVGVELIGRYLDALAAADFLPPREPTREEA